jgi:branched-chain amino acid transport system ATP-binding protein
MLLKISNLNVTLGGLSILRDINLSVDEGELVVVVGANGAGKSTLLRTLNGIYQPVSGSAVFRTEPLLGLKAHEVIRKGLCMVPEGRQLFPSLSARENLLLGAYYYKRDKKRVLANLERVYALFPILKKHENRIASTFSGGEQQMISIGRGLMGEPKLMMIDELSLGLAPKVVSSLFLVIKELNKTGMSILLIEQNVRQALQIADHAYVLENGSVSLSGSGKELLDNPEVKEAYLGL